MSLDDKGRSNISGAVSRNQLSSETFYEWFNLHRIFKTTHKKPNIFDTLKYRVENDGYIIVWKLTMVIILCNFIIGTAYRCTWMGDPQGSFRMGCSRTASLFVPAEKTWLYISLRYFHVLKKVFT